MRKVCSNNWVFIDGFVYTVTDCWYYTYLGKGSHLSFLNRSEDGIDKSTSNIKWAAPAFVIWLFCFVGLLDSFPTLNNSDLSVVKYSSYRIPTSPIQGGSFLFLLKYAG